MEIFANINKLSDSGFVKGILPSDGLEALRPNSIVIISGPTAIGKSALAMEIAKQNNGVIINADSLQVYKDLQILSARPSHEEMSIIPHKLYGFMEIQETCSVALWLEMASREIVKAWEKDMLPIVVGGTGMYIRSLYQGIAKVPTIPKGVIKESERLINEVGNKAFFEKLAKLDPKIAKKLHENDTQRLLRAYNVIKATGKSLLDFQESSDELLLNDNIKKVLLASKRMLAMVPVEKKWLLARAAERFDKMIEMGAIDEVKKLLEIIRQCEDSNTAINGTVTKAIGVPQLIQYLKGEVTMDKAKELSKIATNQYVKRQLTWIRNQFILNYVIKPIVINVGD